MRVLQVYRTYFPDLPGGIQQVMRQIAIGTKPYGVEMRLFALSPDPVPKRLTFPECDVFRAKSLMAPASCDIGGLAAFRRFARLARWADVVHLHFPWPFADVLNLLVPHGKPMVLTYHSDIVRQQTLKKFYAPLMNLTLRSAAAVVATSPNYAASSEVLKALPPEKLSVIPIGIADQSADQPKTDILERHGLEKNGYFLALGVLRYYKGLHHLVAAASQIPGKIVIAGSGPEDERLKAQAAALGLSNLVFAGQVSEAEKTALLQGSRALILSSHLRSEAFGVVLLDASMHGKPMICCEIGSGTSYVNQDGVTGLVVPPENPAALAEAAGKLWADPALAAQMGAAARQRYLTLFSSEKQGEAYANLYAKLAKG